MPKRSTLMVNVLITALFVAARPLQAEWPENGSAVCTTSSQQFFPQIVPDGLGGAIIAWEDYTGMYLGGTHDIYAQRLSGAGEVLWA